MLKGIAWGITLTVAVALVTVYTLLHSGMIPANADAKPGGLELWMAGTSLDATLDRYAPKEQNPVALTDENLLKGVKLYQKNCAICHGTAEGKKSPSPIAKGEYPGPPQLGSDGVEDDPEGYSFWKIKHGIRLTGMPSFRHTLKDEQIWTLALFLKHMDKLPPAVQEKWKQVRNWPVAFPEQAGQK